LIRLSQLCKRTKLRVKPRNDAKQRNAQVCEAAKAK